MATSAFPVQSTWSVLLVVLISFVMTIVTISSALLFVTIQFIFFSVLPLLCAGLGAALLVSPSFTQLGEDDLTVMLLRIIGAVTITYSSGAALAGRSPCFIVQGLHLAATAAALCAVASVAFSNGEAVVGEELGAKIGMYLNTGAGVAVSGALMSFVVPKLSKIVDMEKLPKAVICD